MDSVIYKLSSTIFNNYQREGQTKNKSKFNSLEVLIFMLWKTTEAVLKTSITSVIFDSLGVKIKKKLLFYLA